MCCLIKTCVDHRLVDIEAKPSRGASMADRPTDWFHQDPVGELRGHQVAYTKRGGIILYLSPRSVEDSSHRTAVYILRVVLCFSTCIHTFQFERKDKMHEMIRKNKIKSRLPRP